jgi:hypothetical protein
MLIIRILKNIFISLIIVQSSLSNAALMFDRGGTLLLQGEITAGDLEKSIIPAYKNIKGKKYIHLNSSGGDVEEAMKIGRYFKKNEFSVSVAYRDSCYSSCAFLLAGGVERHAVGKVGIHRPYFGSLDKSLTITQIKEFREKINLNIKNYLTEMDINPSLLEVMNSYPPESMKILNDEELTTYRLNLKDANFEEKEVAKQAFAFNMTSSEWRVKSENAHAQCRGVKGEPCFAMKMLNISKSELQIRIDRMDKCNGDTEFCFRKHVARGEK